MATQSSVLAWRIPGPGKPDGLPSKGSHRVGHDCSDLAAAANLREQQIDGLKRGDLSVKGSGTLMSDLGSNSNIAAYGLTE